jgi:trans-aconitate methyltransferase
VGPNGLVILTHERDAAHWTRYNGQQSGREVRPLLVKALGHAVPGSGRIAIDIGCGAGIEAGLLLAAGWTVYALDSDEHSLRQLRSVVEASAASRLVTCVVDLNDLPELPEADLIYGGYALPYARPARFRDMWSTVTRALATGGVIAVNLFGDRDSWADLGHETYLTEAETRALFEGLEILDFNVEDEDGPAFSGPKHWHIFDVIARRPEA